MFKAKKWIKSTEFTGMPTVQNFRLEEEELPKLQDGEILLEAVYLTVDPYMRAYGVEAGTTMIGQSLCRVTESRHPAYPVGSEWLYRSGWRSHCVVNPAEAVKQGDTYPFLLPVPPLGDLPHSLALGTLGMPGATAYLGFFDLGEPKPGDTVLVNDAAGAVGHVVGQVAKIKLGCKVIGYAGSDEKMKWLKEELGFDFAFNYKKVNLSESLKEAAPKGIDVYYDNVGGDFTDTVMMNHMKIGARAVIVGAISLYNVQDPPKGPLPYRTILFKGLSVRGFIVGREFPQTRWAEAFGEMTQWIKEGKMKYREHITNGFDKMPEAFIELFTGTNVGKAIVKV